jgi:hypothetical protein
VGLSGQLSWQLFSQSLVALIWTGARIRTGGQSRIRPDSGELTPRSEGRNGAFLSRGPLRTSPGFGITISELTKGV